MTNQNTEFKVIFKASGHEDKFNAESEVIEYVREEVKHTAPNYFKEDGYLFTDEEEDSLPNIFKGDEDISEYIYSQI